MEYKETEGIYHHLFYGMSSEYYYPNLKYRRNVWELIKAAPFKEFHDFISAIPHRVSYDTQPVVTELNFRNLGLTKATLEAILPDGWYKYLYYIPQGMNITGNGSKLGGRCAVTHIDRHIPVFNHLEHQNPRYYHKDILNLGNYPDTEQVQFILVGSLIDRQPDSLYLYWDKNIKLENPELAVNSYSC